MSSSTPLETQAPGSTTWWRDAVIYQVYPRSFADANGDGIGDLPGITARLDHLAELGVHAVWLSPFYTSPMADAGYDVADYRDVDPVFGTLADADAMIARAHELGLRVIVDLVPNHTSDDHAWFRAALAAGPGSTERARYIFRDGRGPGGDDPPNNWTSVFGGAAWTRVTEPDGTPGQWYLHLFDTRQPDLDWDHPEVRAEFVDVLRFWLDRGVDGFRVDVANALVKADGLPDHDVELALLSGATEDGPTAPMWDRDEVHEIYREWRKVLDSYEPAGSRMMVAEAWVEPPARLAMYVRPDEMHQAFNFTYLGAAWEAKALRDAVERSMSANDAVGAPTTWVLSNHDVVRHASRLGTGTPGSFVGIGLGPRDPQPDAALGLRRARAATALMLALPGSAYLYQGEELGLPEHTTLPDEVRQDPTFFRHDGAVVGRDGCRVPIPWTGDAPAYGFSPTGESWLPQPPEFGDLAVDRQEGVDGSTLELYRRAIRLRRELALGHGEVTWDTTLGDDDVLAMRRSTPLGEVLVLTNLGTADVAVPDGVRVVLSTEDGPHPERDAATTTGTLAPDVTLWALME
ncbi:glycoside hydrolase family 13 protein [Nocardioides massiliensis]|uniref:Alpha-glucosidase n=1 Tax=Nocardioides massiliensis TaxID=1325935 RepID=A0ABT9NMD2_9ACTN|nr:glycoside hydrolase family 13 protein [Nocardioides massiliensis]MDP9821577.1 alpha-glucosidase [Nocardioides massiliensis]